LEKFRRRLLRQIFVPFRVRIRRLFRRHRPKRARSSLPSPLVRVRARARVALARVARAVRAVFVFDRSNRRNLSRATRIQNHTTAPCIPTRWRKRAFTYLTPRTSIKLFRARATNPRRRARGRAHRDATSRHHTTWCAFRCARGHRARAARRDARDATRTTIDDGWIPAHNRAIRIVARSRRPRRASRVARRLGRRKSRGKISSRARRARSGRTGDRGAREGVDRARTRWIVGARSVALEMRRVDGLRPARGDDVARAWDMDYPWMMCARMWGGWRRGRRCDERRRPVESRARSVDVAGGGWERTRRDVGTGD